MTLLATRSDRPLVELPDAVRGTEYWRPSYHPTSYDVRRQLRKLQDVADYLLRCTDVDPAVVEQDLAASVAQTIGSFELYEGSRDPDFDASFCFVVPTRLERGSEQYSDEVVGRLPLLRHVGPATRQLVVAGTCPVVIETYRPDHAGRRGAMVLAPIFKDLATDASDPATALETAFQVIAATAGFVRNGLGAEVMGLGATLPLLTFLARKFLGMRLEVPGLTVTTGHGGTVWLLHETIALARDRLALGTTASVGFIGAGGIGRSAAAYLLADDPAARVAMYDTDAGKLHRVTAELGATYGSGRVEIARSARELLSRGGVVVSAVASPVSLEGPEYAGLDLRGTFVLDDSQPHAVSREAVEARGGQVGWVIGEDGTEGGSLTFAGDFDYGGWGPARPNEVWGCEAEAGSIYLQHAPEAAITASVTPEAARPIGELCRASSIGPAPLQSFGRYLTVPAQPRLAPRRSPRPAPQLVPAFS